MTRGALNPGATEHPGATDLCDSLRAAPAGVPPSRARPLTHGVAPVFFLTRRYP